jgi:hypothetical protein
LTAAAAGGRVNETVEDQKDKKIHRSAFQIALMEFVIIFGCALGWHIVRKTGESIFDPLGEAAIAAGLLYFWERDKKP